MIRTYIGPELQCLSSFLLSPGDFGHYCYIELKFENLTRHMKTKHEDNSFECQECNQKFNRRCNLTRHINTVHKKLDMKKCTECTKLYSDKYKLRNHKCKGIKGRQASMKTKGAQ